MSELALLDWPDTPPSLNRQGRTHPLKQYRLKREIEENLFPLLLEAKVRRQLEFVEASAVLRFPVRRIRDEGNFRWYLEKALGDVLKAGGWLPEDTPDHYRFRALDFDTELGPKRTLIALSYR